MSNKLQERHSIKPFRDNSLGIIKLNELAYPSNHKMKIMIGEKQIFPIGFDTYGHPIISETNFAYYQAQKSIVERGGESLVPIVEYESAPFCIKRSMYDFTPKKPIYTSEYDFTPKKPIYTSEEEGNVYSTEQSSIEEIKDLDLESLKQILNNRKKAAFCGKELYNFVLFNQYLLSSNGKVYAYFPNETYEKDIVKLDNEVDTSKLKEVHLPGPNDKCDICGKAFTIEDIKNFEISENEKCLKVHKTCLSDYTEAIEHKKASHMIDSVYDGRPPSQVIKKYDEEGKEIKWYVYKTNQGTISIRFKRKVVVIEWHDNFKPFNMSIFEDERVTKFDRGIHAWSKDDAIRYLTMAKKA